MFNKTTSFGDHTAVIVRDKKNQIFVYDAATNWLKPLAYTEWISAIGGSINSVAVCNHNSYHFEDPCWDPYTNHASKVAWSNDLFNVWGNLMVCEESMLKSRGFNLTLALGDYPPWLM